MAEDDGSPRNGGQGAGRVVPAPTRVTPQDDRSSEPLKSALRRGYGTIASVDDSQHALWPADDGEAAMRAAADATAGHDRGLHRLTLRFADQRLESGFRMDFYRNVIPSVRAAHVLGIGAWAIWGLIFGEFAQAAPTVDLIVRFGVFIPMTVVGLIVVSLPIARRIWEAEAVILLLLTGAVWTVYVLAIAGVPFDLGYVGVILILAFSYTLLRLRFVLVAGFGIALIATYLAGILAVGRASGEQILLAVFYLGSFYTLGLIASYTLERFTRLLFLRERQLDHERRRSDALLLNVLPEAIAERLKERAETGATGPDGRPALADGFSEVAVLFADLVGFTEQAGRTTPDALVETLDDLFSEMDALADRYGLEKIKTVGDAYMAVAGVPTEVGGPAARAMEMALDLVTVMQGRRWPSGDPLGVRVGIATGPVVAGVIGRRKFAYDVWGDTVNLASRLEGAARPGCILVAEAAVERVDDQFVFGPLESLDLKGKGSQPVRTLEGRTGDRDADGELAVSA